MEPCLGSLLPVVMDSFHPQCIRPLCVCVLLLHMVLQSHKRRQSWVSLLGAELGALGCEKLGQCGGVLEQSRAGCWLGDTTGLPGKCPCPPRLQPHPRADLALWGVLQVVGCAKGRITGS